jgi:lipid-A-disaccharide synthase
VKLFDSDALSLGMVVGEVSGENLAHSLLQTLQSRFNTVNLRGILGEKLVASGGHALYPMEKLSVVGLIEPLFRIPELFHIRRSLIQNFIQNPPDVFIGVDAPDFNLGLEGLLKKQGIPTVHYVSPTVWAWRQGRIHKIKKAVDLMLALFPFEAKFYEQHNMPVCFTGHPLADQIPLDGEEALKTRTREARKTLGLALDKPVIALMPGSRNREITTLSEIYLHTAKWCHARDPNIQFVVALVKEAHKQQFLALKDRIAPELSMLVLAQQGSTINTTTLAISACDVALVKAGTATLEVMLHKKPMAVSYRVHPLTYQIFKRLVKVPWVALPNLLAEEQLVPEFLQQDMQPELMGRTLLHLLEGGNSQLSLHRHKAGDKFYAAGQDSHATQGMKGIIKSGTHVINRNTMIERFSELHHLLKRDASVRGALAIEELLNRKKFF